MAELTLSVRDAPERHRYEAVVDGRVAFAEYILRDAVITFVHTVVPAELEGKGVGSAIAKGVLEDARARGLSVIPRCPFIHAYISRHAEYLDLVDASYRDQM